MQFFYLLLSIYFGRRNSLFFLVFPFALLQGPGAFIDTRTVLIAPEVFLIGKNILKDITIFYLLGLIIYFRNKVKFNLIYQTPMKWLALYYIFLIITTLLFYGSSYEAIAIIRLFLYMILGYYLLILFFSTVEYQQFIEFFNVLFFVNIIQSILYVVNSSKTIQIFDDSMLYMEIDSAIGNGSFIRDFLTIPLFSDLLFFYALVSIILNENVFNKKILYATLITYPFVLLFTFTRSVLFSAGLQVIIIFFVLIKLKSSKILRPSMVVLVVGAAVLFGIVKSNFKNEFGYFNERIAGAVSEGKEEENVNIRLQYHEKAWELLSRNNSLLIGNGLNKNLEVQMDEIGAWSADSTIPFLLIFTGLSGLIIYYLIQIYYVFMCSSNSFYGINSLAITLYSIMIVNIFSSLIMGGNAWGSPLFYFEYTLIVYIDYLYKERINDYNQNRQTAIDIVQAENIKSIRT